MTGRWTCGVSAAGVLVLAAAAFTLSYDALHQFALDSRVRPGLAWLWPMMIDSTIVVALLTVLAALCAATRGRPWALARLFSAASVAFHIRPAPDRPVAQLVFAMAPVPLVLPPSSCNRSAGDGRRTHSQAAPSAEHEAVEAAHSHGWPDHPEHQPPPAEQPHPVECPRPSRGGLRSPDGGRARPRPAPASPEPQA